MSPTLTALLPTVPWAIVYGLLRHSWVGDSWSYALLTAIAAAFAFHGVRRLTLAWIARLNEDGTSRPPLRTSSASAASSPSPSR